MATIDGNNSELPEISTSDANKVVIVNTTGDDYILTTQSSISSSIVVDSALSSSSTNPVQNDVIKNALDGKQSLLQFNAPSSDNGRPSTSAQILAALNLKQDNLTIDTSPSDGSTNPITSNAVFDALALKQDNLTIDTSPSDGSTNPITSNAVFDGLALKQDTITDGDLTIARTSGLQTALDTKITASSDDTLTNKAFNVDGTGNTLFNIANANIKGSAGINATKIADGSISNAEFQTLNGITTTSTIASQLGDKQDTIDSSNKLASANINFSTDIAVNEDGTNARSTFNFTSIGTRSATGQADAMMCHKDYATDSNSYAIVQLDTGKTIVNSKSGTNLELRNGDSLIAEVATDGIGVKAGSFGRSQFNNTLIGNKSTPNNDTSCIIMHSAFAANNTNNVNSYALFQNSSGTTAVNCRTGANLAFRVNNADKLLLTGTTGQLTGSAISTSFDSSTSANQLASVGAIRNYVTANAGGSTGPKIVAYGKFNGTNGNLIRGLGLTCNRTAQGNYTMTLGSARPTADYSVFFSVIELLNNRDDLIITANNGSFTTTTFQLILTEQDNGTAGGQFRDKDFCVQVVDHD